MSRSKKLDTVTRRFLRKTNSHNHTHTYVYNIVKLATVVEGNTEAPFSIATTPREGSTPFPGLIRFTLDPYHKMLSVKQGSIK